MASCCYEGCCGTWCVYGCEDWGYCLYISHLFYVDDSLFIGKWEAKSVQSLVYIIICVYMASRLRLILSNSNLIEVSSNSHVFNKF